MMINKYSSASPVEMMPGLIRRTLAEGKSMMICEFILDAGVEIPGHAHPQEQIGYIASGKVRLIIEGERFDLGPGDTYYAPSGAKHGAIALERSVVVDSFSPPREDYR
ncbi:MAG: cupin domain-containing protein [Methanotrichaceae archaeon]